MELRRIDEEKVAELLQLKKEAEQLNHTFVAAWVQEKFIFISIWVGKKSNHSRLDRVVVSFDKETYDLVCWCTHSSYQGCNHKTIAKWYLAAAFPEIYTNPGPASKNKSLEDCVNKYSQMTDYLYQTMKLPFQFPLKALTEKCGENILFPKENKCYFCDGELCATMV